MATSSRSSAEGHAQEQTALVVLMLRELDALWPAVEAEGASEETVSAMAALIAQYADVSAGMAADWYDAERRAAGVRGRFTVALPPPPSREQVAGSLSFTTRGLRPETAVPQPSSPAVPAAAGPRRLGRSSRRLVPQQPGRAPAVRPQVEGAAQRLVVNAGRETVARAVTDDRGAQGWVREATGPTTCSFCRLMCIRGPVYSSAGAAGRNQNFRFVGDGEFKFHDNDDCIARPVFDRSGYEPPEYVREWEQQYYDATSAVSGKEKARAFRRAVEAAARG